ncbi:MAG: hypothetical protein WD048_07020 [Chitinophagales bacterium]
MKQEINAFLIVCLLYVCSCNPINLQPTNELFNPNPNVTYNSLLKNGYKPIVEDVIILGFEKNDTFIYYQFDNIDEKPVYEIVKIKSKNIDEHLLNRLFNTYNLSPLNEGCFNIEQRENFYVMNDVNKFIYRISFRKEKNQDFYYITGFTEFPISP